MNLSDFPFWHLCESCGVSNGGDTSGVGCITVTLGTCPLCDQEEQTLIPVVDFKWPFDSDLDYEIRWD